MYIAKINDEIYHMQAISNDESTIKYVAKRAVNKAGLYSPYNKDEYVEVEMYELDGIDIKPIGNFTVLLEKEPMDVDDYEFEINKLIEAFPDDIKKLIWKIIDHADRNHSYYNGLFEANKNFIITIKQLINRVIEIQTKLICHKEGWE